MAASRAVLFVLVVIPVNLAIISRLTGLTFKQLLRGTPAPLVAGLLAVGAVAGLQALGLLDGVPPVPALDHHAGIGDCDHGRRPDAARRLGTACRAKDIVQAFAAQASQSTDGRARELDVTVSFGAMSGASRDTARWFPSILPRSGRW